MFSLHVAHQPQFPMCYAELDVGYEVSRIHLDDLTPLTFHRDYVSRNKPVIITGRPLHDAQSDDAGSGLRTPSRIIKYLSDAQLKSLVKQIPYESGALEAWPAAGKWNRATLELAMGSSQVSISMVHSVCAGAQA